MPCLWFEWSGSKMITLGPTLDYTTFVSNGPRNVMCHSLSMSLRHPHLKPSVPELSASVSVMLTDFFHPLDLPTGPTFPISWKTVLYGSSQMRPQNVPPCCQICGSLLHTLSIYIKQRSCVFKVRDVDENWWELTTIATCTTIDFWATTAVAYSTRAQWVRGLQTTNQVYTKL